MTVEVPKRIQQVLEVVDLIDSGHEFREAAKKVATKWKVDSTTIADACTRRLGLNVDGFKKLAKNHERLRVLLAK